MSSSIIGLTNNEVGQVGGGFGREEVAVFCMGIFVGLAYGKISSATIYSDQLDDKIIAIIKVVSLSILLVTGAIKAVNWLKR